MCNKPHGGNFRQLKECVIDASESKVWTDAVLEWEISGASFDASGTSECVCGQKHIKRLFEIRNFINGIVLYPIGSECIKRFGNDELSSNLRVLESFFRLLEYVDDAGWYNPDRTVILKDGVYSRALFKFMFENGAFVPNDYNHGRPCEDYEFMLDMFNKRSALSVAQHKKERAIIRQYLYPWMRKYYKLYSEGKPVVFEPFKCNCCYYCKYHLN